MSQTAVDPVRERPRKSLGTAIALAFFLGPVGLAYASLTGAVVMLAVSAVVLVPILLGVHINMTLYFPIWVVCIVWAAFAAQERTGARSGSALEVGTHSGAGESGPGTAQPNDGAPGRS